MNTYPTTEGVSEDREKENRVSESWDEVRQRYALASADFLALLGQLDAAAATRAGVCGTWSAKEIVAHLAGWLWEGERRLRNRFKEGGQPMPPVDNVDARNAAAVAERADLSWQETLDELRRADMTFAATAAQVSQRDHDADARYAHWVAIMVREYGNHGAEIRAVHAAPSPP